MSKNIKLKHSTLYYPHSYITIFHKVIKKIEIDHSGIVKSLYDTPIFSVMR